MAKATSIKQTTLKDLKQHYPELYDLIQLREAKGKDYNNSVELTDYFPFGQKSYTQMIYLKAMRLRALTENQDPALFDSIQDTLMDLVNYAIFNIEAVNRGDKL